MTVETPAKPSIAAAPPLPPRVEVSERAGANAAAARGAAPIRLATRDFHFFYGKQQALKGITLAIPSGSVTAIIGPSGCGKSTLLRSFNRMNDLIPGVHMRGKVEVSGIDVFAPGTDVVALRRRVGMVFQRPNPFPKSIFENAAFGLRMLGVDREEVAQRVEQGL